MLKIRRKIKIETKYGAATFISFHGLNTHQEHFALVFKDAEKQKFPLVRVHSECITGDLFGSCRCDCGAQLNEALENFSKSGGVLLYLRQEGRGIGLYNKLDAYAVQDKGFDTFEANIILDFPEDNRCFDVAAKMLKALNINHIDLLSNNPSKYSDLKSYGIFIRNKVNTGCYMNKFNMKYLLAKINKAGHTFKNNMISLTAR